MALLPAPNPPSNTDPAQSAVAVTPSDSTDLANPARALYIGTGGDVIVTPYGTPSGGTSVTFKAVPTGTILPVMVRRVLATGTGASNIVALY